MDVIAAYLSLPLYTFVILLPFDPRWMTDNIALNRQCSLFCYFLHVHARTPWMQGHKYGHTNTLRKKWRDGERNLANSSCLLLSLSNWNPRILLTPSTLQSLKVLGSRHRAMRVATSMLSQELFDNYSQGPHFVPGTPCGRPGRVPDHRQSHICPNVRVHSHWVMEMHARCQRGGRWLDLTPRFIFHFLIICMTTSVCANIRVLDQWNIPEIS